MVMLDWPVEEKQAFLKQQFEAQHKYYHQVFKKAAFDLVLLDGRPAGRLYVDRREDEIRVIDIALLPEHRGRGIGGKLMGDVLAEGQKAGKPVRIHVERNNPALHLYHRLGFQPVEDQGVYHLMEWRPKLPGE
ncbi:MAG: GNAT family N-acetyltransferase [Acidobacteria bacterium]|nr:GNAT family N-acetyltransferase [Acidobacteriota bacterium]